MGVGKVNRMKSISEIGTTTKLCGIIGNPVSHSMSPAIHNRAFEALDLDFVYLAFEVNRIHAVLDGMRAINSFRGLSVTIPHKVAVTPFLDEIDTVDEKIGSINTVVNEGGRLRGFGTDGPGARKALRSNSVDLEGKEILILGSGGAARAIAFDLAYNAAPAGLYLLGIVEPELRALADSLNEKSPVAANSALMDDSTLAAAMEKADVVIQTTPVGMHPKINQSLIPPHLLHEGMAIMDIVYNPLKTQLLKDAEAKGLKTVSGLDMFVNQAALQFEAWTGKSAPVEMMREVVLEKLG
jgi:shikimate dehydrogenase